jgi:hypothetical protein
VFFRLTHLQYQNLNRGLGSINKCLRNSRQIGAEKSGEVVNRKDLTFWGLRTSLNSLEVFLALFVSKRQKLHILCL